MSIRQISEFYAAFNVRNYEKMNDKYHPDASFTDPAFGTLKGSDVTSMWEMLCRGSQDLSVKASKIRMDGNKGSASWIATYTFSKTGRKVTNHVRSEFWFKEGLIQTQRDSFSFWRWSRMALGPMGAFLGWLPPFKNAFQAQARKSLAAYVSKTKK